MAYTRLMMRDDTTFQTAAVSVTDSVQDSWIDWAAEGVTPSGGKVGAVHMKLEDTGAWFSTKNVEWALQKLASDVSTLTTGVLITAPSWGGDGMQGFNDTAATPYRAPEIAICFCTTGGTPISNLQTGERFILYDGSTTTTLVAGTDFLIGGSLEATIVNLETAVEAVTNFTASKMKRASIDPGGNYILLIACDGPSSRQTTVYAKADNGTPGNDWVGGQPSYLNDPVHDQHNLAKLMNTGTTTNFSSGANSSDGELTYISYSGGAWFYHAATTEFTQVLPGNLATITGVLPGSGLQGGGYSGTVTLSLGALTGNWDAGSYKITALQVESDATTGTAPFVVASTTVVSNLNADTVDGSHASSFAASSHTHSGSDITSGSVAATVGGTGQTAVATGDILYGSAPNTWSRLPKGTNDYFLHLNSSTGAVEWAYPTGTLPAGASGNTLYHNGSAWAANANILMTGGNSLVLNDSVSFKLGTGGADDVVVSNGSTTTWTHNTGDISFISTASLGAIRFLLGTATNATVLSCLDVSGTQALMNIFGSGTVQFPGLSASGASVFTIGDKDSDLWFKINTGTPGIELGNTNRNPLVQVLGTSGLQIPTGEFKVGTSSFEVGPDGIVDEGIWQATSIKSDYGGTGQTSYTAGDMLYYASGTSLSKLGMTSSDAFKYLRVNSGGTAPEWSAEGATITTSVVCKSAVNANRIVAAFNDSGTAKLDEASAGAASTKYSVAGVALAGASGGAAVKLQITGLVTCRLKSGGTAVTGGQVAYLRQEAGGYVCNYSDIAMTSTAYIAPVGVFMQNANPSGGDTDVLVALGAVGTQAALIP